jgi:hypothetical protein
MPLESYVSKGSGEASSGLRSCAGGAEGSALGAAAGTAVAASLAGVGLPDGKAAGKLPW